MKKIISICLFVGVSLFGFSQITVSDYTRAFKVDANDIPAPDVEFTSTCGEVKVEITERMASGGCLGNLIRSYAVSDSCGNTAVAEQYLSLQDHTGPEIIGIPEDISVNDNDDIPEAPVVGAKDYGNQKIKVTLSEEKTPNKIIRRWKAVDKCGNETIKTQTISISNHSK